MSVLPDEITAMVDAVRSHALALGRFDREAGHEPRNVPGRGLTVAVWVDRIDPVARASGLAATSIRVLFNVRVYAHADGEPADEIDPAVTRAVWALMLAYSADFTLGDRIKEVDLLGRHGVSLRAQAGYVRQDGVLLRVMTISLPLVINDAFDQEA